MDSTLPLRHDSRWSPLTLHPIVLEWGARHQGSPHRCPRCNLILLTGEKPGFCCGEDGKHLHEVDPLPPFPDEYVSFLSDPRLSSLSRCFNLLFSFASLETTMRFPDEPSWYGFVAIGGKVYHRIRPEHAHSSVRWILYDGFHPQRVPYADSYARDIPPTWISNVQHALLRVNPFARALLQLNTLPPALCAVASVVLEENTTSEIAACLTYDNTSFNEVNPRRIVIRRLENNRLIHIPTISRLWEPLAYPLLFPEGSLGWGVIGAVDNIVDHFPPHGAAEWGKLTTQMWYYRARLLREARFEIFGRLANEYIVDMFTRDLDTRLKYIETHQRQFYAEDEALMGPSVEIQTENVYLPSSFLGSRRWASEQIADSLAIAAQLGPPTFFITMTCNADWPEISSRLRPGQHFSDIPLVVCRVFRQKLALLEARLKTLFPNVGTYDYLIHVVEFQKRGLPHAHILVKYPASCTTPSDIDQVISTEFPPDPSDAALVRKFMLHRHPLPTEDITEYCQRLNDYGERVCRFHYPFPRQPFTTITAEGRVNYRRRTEEDCMVVPHNLSLLRAFNCHLYFEAAGPSHIFQYIFKYIHKGPDMTRLTVTDPNASFNEIEDFWKARSLRRRGGMAHPWVLNYSQGTCGNRFASRARSESYFSTVL